MPTGVQVALIIGNMLFGFDPMVRMVAVCVASAGGWDPRDQTVLCGRPRGQKRSVGFEGGIIAEQYA